MPIDLGGIKLSKIHRINTVEQADFVRHRVPGLEGDLTQDMGRPSVRLEIEGIFYGATAADDLDALRNLYKARQPISFLADIVGQAYFAQVLLDQFDVQQRADEPEQYSYRLVVAEYVPPPQPPSPGLAGGNASILNQALGFMNAIQLPNLLGVPDLFDPTEPLNTIVDGVKEKIESVLGPAQQLNQLFTKRNGSNR